MEEIERKGDRLVTAEDRLWHTYIQFLSSRYGDAHRTGVDSLAILFKQDDLNPFFVFYLEHVYHWLVLRNLLLWGAWGQVLKEVEVATALLEKNGDNARGQEVLVHKAWVHLHAMDFSGVIAIVKPLFASVLTPSPVRDLHILIGSAEAGLGDYDCALEHFLKVRDDLDRQPLMDGWYQSMSFQAGLAELWLRKGDLAQARREAERFLDVALSTAERTYQGLAWEANAQVAIAGQEWKRAEECIANGLSTIEGYEVPLAAWQVHGTAAELYARAGSNDLAEHHREPSRAVIVKLANSLGPEDPLRATFLSAPPIRKVLDYADRIV
jgi:tetratricopeptide (TPR) repeat protein